MFIQLPKNLKPIATFSVSLQAPSDPYSDKTPRN
jgi:hypothetical protein